MDVSTIKSDNLDKINKMLEDENELNVKFSTKWAEHEAVIYLQQELEKYRGIFDTTGIQIDDKGISYDGRIQVINNANRNKNEWIGYIDIQVKGTCVDEIKRGNSKFTVDVSDLENYAKHPLGVLSFVVQIKKDTLEKKIFYRFLLPVDLRKIFRTITNQKTKTIDIYPLI